MSTYELNPRSIRERVIDFKKLEQDFMPNFHKEIACYKKAIIHNARDRNGRPVKDATWPRDEQPNERAYYNWLKDVHDENWKPNPAKDERGNEIKGTGAKHVIQGILRVRTVKGEFLVTDGKLVGYDAFGNVRERTCRHPEEWVKTNFNFTRGIDPSSGQTYTQCLGPSGLETVYEMPFTKENLRQLVKHREGDNIPFALVDLTKDGRPKSVPIQGGIESRVKFFLQDFDYLWNEDYKSKEEKAWAHRIDELILSGRASSEQEANRIAELEIEEKKPPIRKDGKTGVA